VRSFLLVVAAGLCALGVFGALSSPTPEGYDADIHGSNAICSSAVLEVLGIGSKDTNTAASPEGDGPSIGIDDCKGPARRQTALATAAIVAGIGVLVVRRRVPIPPMRPIGG